jgi:hypothetical protein
MQQSDLSQEIFSSSRPSLYSRESNPSLRIVSNRTPSYHSDRIRTGSVRHSLLKGGKGRLDSSDLPAPPILTRMNSTDTIIPIPLKTDDHIGHHGTSKVRAADIGASTGHHGTSRVRQATMEPLEAQKIDQSYHGTLPENRSGYIGTSKVRSGAVAQENSPNSPQVHSMLPFIETRSKHHGRPRYESKVRALSDETVRSSGDSSIGSNAAHGGHSWVEKVQSFHNASSRMLTSDRLQSIPHLVSSETTGDDSPAETGESRASSY